MTSSREISVDRLRKLEVFFSFEAATTGDYWTAPTGDYYDITKVTFRGRDITKLISRSDMEILTEKLYS